MSKIRGVGQAVPPSTVKPTTTTATTTTNTGRGAGNTTAQYNNGNPTNNVAGRNGINNNTRADLDRKLADQKKELLLDLGQAALDIVGIVDPTPISDGANTLISLFRGNWGDAALSAIGMVPYIGDLAKAGKLPKFLKTIGTAIDIAKTDAKFAKELAPVLEKIKSAVDKIPLKDLPKSIREPLESMKKQMDDFLTGAKKTDTPQGKPPVQGKDFEGTYKGEKVTLPGVKTETFTYTKRADADRIKLRNEFDSSGRSNFLKKLGKENEADLKKAGFSDADIKEIKAGKVPDGWQVHHKKPLDDGGDNSFGNLVLIKQTPYHSAITTEQNRLIKGMKPGDSKVVEFPIPPGSIYPPKP